MSDERTHWVYEAIDADGISLYVGCTKNPTRRYREHMSGNGDGRGWFQRFVVRWSVSGPYAPTVARSLEKRWIEELDPVYNAMSPTNRDAPDRRLHVKRYLAEHPTPIRRAS